MEHTLKSWLLIWDNFLDFILKKLKKSHTSEEEAAALEDDEEVFEMENIEEVEVSLCELINENFRMDDDDLFAGLDL